VLELTAVLAHRKPHAKAPNVVDKATATAINEYTKSHREALTAHADP
jgi:hypothetical protein